jgi:hypothetical protein
MHNDEGLGQAMGEAAARDAITTLTKRLDDLFKITQSLQTQLNELSKRLPTNAPPKPTYYTPEQINQAAAKPVRVRLAPTKGVFLSNLEERIMDTVNEMLDAGSLKIVQD